MNVSYSAPLARAWQRMQNMLFRPFRIETWFVVGFAAFLACLGQSGGGGGNALRWRDRGHDTAAGAAVVEHARQQVLNVLAHPVWLWVFMVLLLAAGVVIVIVAWVSARAKFVFLDNVATGRPGIVEPWRRFGRLGRSLFLWFAAFSFAWLLPIGVLAATFGGAIVALATGATPVLPAVGVMVAGAGAFVLLALAIGFVGAIMEWFVVPLMYRYDENATQAWTRFRPLLTSRFGEFFAFALFIVILWIAAVIALIIAGVATCCVGLILMMIPYIGTVVLLPVFVTDRAFSMEFLAQFGPEWNTFPAQSPSEARVSE